MLAVLLCSAVLAVGCSGSKKETEAPKTTEAKTEATEAPATEAPAAAAVEEAASEAAAVVEEAASEAAAAVEEAVSEAEEAVSEAVEAVEEAASEAASEQELKAAETEAAATETAETEAAVTEAATEAAATEAAETEAPATEAAATEAAETEAPATEEATEAAATEAAATEAAATEAAETEAPATEEATEAAATEAAETEAPATEEATEEATEAPATEEATEEATEAPATEEATEEATEAPATEKATEEATEAPATEEATEEATEAPATEEATEEATEAVTEAPLEDILEPVERPDYVALDHVELGEYTGLPVTVDPVTVSEEEIDTYVQLALEDAAETVTEGTVEKGDVANIDFVGKIDGVEFEGGSGEEYDLEIGSGSFIPGFEDQLIGAAAGDTVDVNVTFPEDYFSEDLAGKDAVFTVTINSIKRVPEASDEAISKATNGEFTTLEAFRENQKEKIEEEKLGQQDQAIEEDLMNQLYNTCTIKDYPDGLVEYGVYRITNYYTQLAELYFGVEFAEFRDNYLGMDEETYNTEVQEMAKQGLQQEMILLAIAEKEELDVTDEEFEAGCEKYAEANGISVDEFKAAYPEGDINYTLRLEKARDFVRANADVTVAEPETETELTLVEGQSEAE